MPFLDAFENRGAVLPPYAGLLEVSDDRTTILPEPEESRGGVDEWLTLLLEHFFVPRGYVLSGIISWLASDDAADRGEINVEGDKLEVVRDRIENPGPSWGRAVYMSEKVKALIQSLVESASSEGCSPDLTVVSAADLKALQTAAGWAA
jgi:hypothetical protein